MQHIITRNDVVGNDATLGHPMIDVFGIHLQRISYIADAKDYKAQNLIVHLSKLMNSKAKVQHFYQTNK